MGLKMSDIELDRTDIRILAELQRDGRLSNQELADRVSLSPSPACAGCDGWKRRASSRNTWR